MTIKEFLACIETKFSKLVHLHCHSRQTWIQNLWKILISNLVRKFGTSSARASLPTRWNSTIPSKIYAKSSLWLRWIKALSIYPLLHLWTLRRKTISSSAGQAAFFYSSRIPGLPSDLQDRSHLRACQPQRNHPRFYTKLGCHTSKRSWLLKKALTKTPTMGPSKVSKDQSIWTKCNL